MILTNTELQAVLTLNQQNLVNLISQIVLGADNTKVFSQINTELSHINDILNPANNSQ